MSSPSDELPDLPDLPSEAPASAPPPAPPAGARPPLRVLDKAPQHLRLAALIVVAGCALPWMPGRLEGPSGLGWLTTLCAKGIMALAAWLWMRQVLHDFGPPLPGLLGQLAGLHLRPARKDAAEGKERRAKQKSSAPTHLEHPFPTGLHALALLLVAAALVLAARDPRIGLGASSGVPEVAMLGWAAFTWVHIAGYERWSGFNPLFPLMFLGMLFAGTFAVLGSLRADVAGSAKLFGILGGAAVAAGGGLAAYTIAEAMMQAKKEGDRKRSEALEARRAARQKKA
jgi:hypothetical protein